MSKSSGGGNLSFLTNFKGQVEWDFSGQPYPIPLQGDLAFIILPQLLAPTTTLEFLVPAGTDDLSNEDVPPFENEHCLFVTSEKKVTPLMAFPRQGEYNGKMNCHVDPLVLQ